MWQELLDFHSSINAPWCVGVGDFNQVLFDWEKQGGGSVNAAARDAFAACLDSCHLLDLGFNGHPFTWKHGDLQECLDRILCSSSW